MGGGPVCMKHISAAFSDCIGATENAGVENAGVAAMERQSNTNAVVQHGVNRAFY